MNNAATRYIFSGNDVNQAMDLKGTSLVQEGQFLVRPDGERWFSLYKLVGIELKHVFFLSVLDVEHFIAIGNAKYGSRA